MGRNSEWPFLAIPNCFEQFFPKIWEEIQNGHIWLFQIFLNNISQKDGKKFGMTKNGCSEFFQTFFPKKTGRNLEWQKFGILNLSKPFWCKKTGREI